MARLSEAAMLIRRLGRSRRGNVAIMAAASLPVLLGALALGVDWGYLGYQKRATQAAADLAAISAASDPTAAAAILHDYIERNRLNLTLLAETAYEAGNRNEKEKAEGFLTYRLGHYAPDIERARAERFTPDAPPYNAVRVRIHKPADLAFAASLVRPLRIDTQAIAGTEGIAAFSIGSRLASLNGGVLNAVLGGLLGTRLSLDVMDYRALLDADIDLLSFLDTAATTLHVSAGSYDQLLETRTSLPQLLAIAADTPGLSGRTRALVAGLAHAATADGAAFALGSLFDIDAQVRGLTATVGVLDLVSAAAAVANGSHQVDIGLDAAVPGLADLSVALLVGEPPVHSAWFAVGRTGTVVRTAQTRLRIDAGIGGSGLLSGIRLHLPIYLELAYAEGAIAGISCTGPGPEDGEVEIAALPGVAEAWIGDIPSDIESPGPHPDFAPADLVRTPLLEIRAAAHAAIENPRPETLHFTARDIREGRVLSTSTNSFVGPLLSSLVSDLRLEVRAIGLPLVPPAILQKAAGATLAAASKPLDAALYNVLLALGVKVGEADLRVTGVRCGRPVLVQ